MSEIKGLIDQASSEDVADDDGGFAVSQKSLRKGASFEHGQPGYISTPDGRLCAVDPQAQQRFSDAMSGAIRLTPPPKSSEKKPQPV